MKRCYIRGIHCPFNFQCVEHRLLQSPAPLGEFPHGGAGINQVIDADACTRMVAAFENARSQSKNFPGLLIGLDHFSLICRKALRSRGQGRKEKRPAVAGL
jgi:hypothetical protein